MSGVEARVPRPQEEAVLGARAPPPRNAHFVALCEAGQPLLQDMTPKAIDSSAEQRGTGDDMETTSLHIVTQILQLEETLWGGAKTRGVGQPLEAMVSSKSYPSRRFPHLRSATDGRKAKHVISGDAVRQAPSKLLDLESPFY
eukprot:379084-Pyramimonas_sp.AAC.1